MSQTHGKSDYGSPPGTPRWVKMFGIIALILILLFVITMFIGGGGHDPRRHMPSSDTGGYSAPSTLG